MKKLILITTIISCFQNAFAFDLPGFLDAGWVEASRNQEIDSFVIVPDYTRPGKDNYLLIVEQTRQVGVANTNVPYPTTCRYRAMAALTDFGPASADTKSVYRSNGKKEPKYTISYSITRITLQPALFNSPACLTFIEEQNNLAAAGKNNVSWSFSDLADDVLTDPWLDKVFVKK
jgi:hypothetical protein